MKELLLPIASKIIEVGEECMLLTDVYSNFKNGKEKYQYAKRNDKVKIIAISEPVVIVEGIKERFTVNVNDLEKIYVKKPKENHDS